VGFPIRKSADQRLFAPPHSLSQRTTSFIASQRQGIHRIPLLHLIALIIDIHPPQTPRQRACGGAHQDRTLWSSPDRHGYDRKDQFCFKYAQDWCGQAPITTGMLAVQQLLTEPLKATGRISSLRCQISRQKPMLEEHQSRWRNCVWTKPVSRTEMERDRLSSRSRRRSTLWWSQTGSNRRPHACKARALPTELWPQRKGSSQS
jgi:hypothetical protein